MNESRTTWILVAALAVVSAALAYVLTRDRSPPEPAPIERIAAQVQEPQPASRFTRAAQSADPNGFANIRSGASVEHPIISRVEQGDTFTTYPQTGQWWEVRASDGTTGYMASEFIRMIGAGAMAPAATPVQAAEAVPVPVAVPAAPVRRAGGMMFPDSDRRLLGGGDVAGLSRGELRVARNEIYARRGRAFVDPSLRRYFEQFAWYRPVASEVGLSRVEAANVAFLQQIEASR